MPRDKKVIERHQLEQFLQYAPLSFDQVAITESEAPDFILSLPEDKTVGVEITQLFWPSQPGEPPVQAIHALYDKIVEFARQKYEEQGGPPVAALVIFPYSFRPSKKDVLPTAEDIATFILNHLPDENEDRRFDKVSSWFYRDHFPENVHSIHIFRLTTNGLSSFTNPRASFVPSLKRQHVAQVIREKERKLPNYHANHPECSEMWLLMVCNQELATQFDLNGTLFTTSLPSDFDRAFIFLYLDKQVHELPLAKR